MFKQNGFTLIELLIVLAILGILAAVAVPAYEDYNDAVNNRDRPTILRDATSTIRSTFTKEDNYLNKTVRVIDTDIGYFISANTQLSDMSIVNAESFYRTASSNIGKACTFTFVDVYHPNGDQRYVTDIYCDTSTGNVGSQY